MGLICCKTRKHSSEEISTENLVTISSASSRHNIHDISNNIKSDAFTLIWLDHNCQKNSLDSLRTRTILREINSNKNCLFYNDLELFLQDIQNNIFNENKILLIISGLYAEKIFTQSRNLLNFISIIIIFCKQSNNYTKYLDISNVTNICDDYDALRTCILYELSSLKFNLFENHSYQTIQLLTIKSNSSSIINFDNIGAYFSYKLFIELLKEIPYTEQAKENMLKQCEEYCRQNQRELNNIKRFRKEYSPSKAIEWYTEESFVYRLINRAFRTEDTSLWYLFRFYIRDLCKQMEIVHREQHHNQLYILYRAQASMPTKEFNNIKTNIGGFISTNGFFSTSKSFDTASLFLQDATDTDDFKVVMFEIKLNSSELKNTIFVDIEKHLKQNGEEEILFDIGTIFKIENVIRNDSEQFWRIQLIATDEGTTQFKEQINSMKKRFQTGNLNLLFGRLLLDMHQYIKADAYFKMMLKFLPSRHPDLSSIHDYIGDLKLRTTDYNSALTHFKLAYDLKQLRLPSDHPDLGITYNNLGNYYKAIGDMIQACLYYKKSLKCKNNSINIAIAKLNIGITCMMSSCYDQAYDWFSQAYDMLQQIQPYPNIEMIMYQFTMGDILFREEKYDQAEIYYFHAFDLCKKYLSIGDLHRTRCSNAIADLYEKQDKNSIRALNFSFEQLSVHEKYLFDKNHISIAYIQMKIGQLSQDINYYRKALDILEINIHQEYLTVSQCQMILANYCEYDEALKLYSLANEIQKKIYPPNHSIILDSEQKLIQLKANKENLINLSDENQTIQQEEEEHCVNPDNCENLSDISSSEQEPLSTRLVFNHTINNIQNIL